MERQLFNELINKAKITKKEFATLFNISQTTVNGWGSNRNKIPYWVKSWLTNYIELQELKGFKEAYIKCSDDLRKANDYIFHLEGEPIGINENTTKEEIILASALNKVGNSKIVNINDLNPNAISEYLADIIKLNETVRDIQQKQKEEMQEMKKEIENIKNK